MQAKVLFIYFLWASVFAEQQLRIKPLKTAKNSSNLIFDTGCNWEGFVQMVNASPLKNFTIRNMAKPWTGNDSTLTCWANCLRQKTVTSALSIIKQNGCFECTVVSTVMSWHAKQTIKPSFVLWWFGSSYINIGGQHLSFKLEEVSSSLF